MTIRQKQLIESYVRMKVKKILNESITISSEDENYPIVAKTDPDGTILLFQKGRRGGQNDIIGVSPGQVAMLIKFLQTNG